MINGAHSIIYSANPEADRAFLRDVLGLPHVDVGQGWLIFGLPPAEVAVHPADKNDVHELYLMCRDVEALLETLNLRDIQSTPVEDQGWGLVTRVTLPGGGSLPIYQPRHARPESPGSGKKPRASSSKKKAPKKKAGKKQASPAPKVGKRPARAAKTAKKNKKAR
jgi:hypothetical protein